MTAETTTTELEKEWARAMAHVLRAMGYPARARENQVIVRVEEENDEEIERLEDIVEKLCSIMGCYLGTWVDDDRYYIEVTHPAEFWGMLDDNDCEDEACDEDEEVEEDEDIE